MRITLESDYALRIISVIAVNDDVTDAKTLSEYTAVSLRFALKILHKLVGGGLVTSYKGVGGGYKLKKPSSEITLKEVIELIDGPIAIVKCLESSECCTLNRDKTACAYHHIFESLSQDVANRLNAITIDDVIQGKY